jgi:hypothetical protein
MVRKRNRRKCAHAEMGASRVPMRPPRLPKRRDRWVRPMQCTRRRRAVRRTRRHTRRDRRLRPMCGARTRGPRCPNCATWPDSRGGTPKLRRGTVPMDPSVWGVLNFGYKPSQKNRQNKKCPSTKPSTGWKRGKVFKQFQTVESDGEDECGSEDRQHHCVVVLSASRLLPDFSDPKYYEIKSNGISPFQKPSRPYTSWLRTR